VTDVVGEDRAAALMSVLRLEEREPRVFVGKTPTTHTQRIFGGQVAGQALMAAALTVPAERPVHSLHSYFLRPGDPDEEIRYAVDAVRDGRTFSTRRVVAWQRRRGEDVAIFTLMADFTAGEAALAEHALPMPDVPPPDELPGIPEMAARHPRRGADMQLISQAIEQRFLDDPFTPAPRTPPHTARCTWLRVTGQLPDDPRVQAAALAFASDLTLMSASVARLGTGWGSFVGASLDHAVWFHRPMRADAWFLYEIDSPSATAGRALCTGEIWAADGTHVATVVQEGLIRSVDDEA
jgi:acyl-CoA thioesterase-2